MGDPAKITLLDVMELMEDSVRCNRCLEDDGFCSRYATEHCEVHDIYATFQEIFDWYFGTITIADLLLPAADRKHREKLTQLLNR